MTATLNSSWCSVLWCSFLICAILLFTSAIPPAFAQHSSTAHGWRAPENNAVESQELLAVYREFNRAYFKGKLPEANVTIAWDESVELDGDIAATWFTAFEGEPEKIEIRISSRLKGYECGTVMAIAHESAHIALRKTKDTGHGKKFQKQMRRLVNKHAFDSCW